MLLQDFPRPIGHHQSARRAVGWRSRESKGQANKELRLLTVQKHIPKTLHRLETLQRGLAPLQTREHAHHWCKAPGTWTMGGSRLIDHDCGRGISAIIAHLETLLGASRLAFLLGFW